MSDKDMICDMCRKLVTELNQMEHMPGKYDADGKYVVPWFCNKCLEEIEDESS
ncbi:MAG: hypothetical protein WC895_04610 [Candidatus Shapirobacteria bacterium]|jgi:hypothetical protein